LSGDIIVKTLVRSVGVLFLSGALIASGSTRLVGAAAAGQTAASGSLSGTASSSSGQVMANTILHLRNLETGELAGATTSSAAGQFSFVGLNPGTYAVEVLNASGRIVGTSGSVAIGDGAAVTGVSVTASAAVSASDASAASGVAAAAGHGSTAAIVGVAAAAAGVVGAAYTGGTASPSQ
jgi:Carboxypeptidase regulatory-like domain